MKNTLPHRFLALLVVGLIGLVMSGCAETVCNAWSQTERLEPLATADAQGTAHGLKEHTGKYDVTPFILSGKTAEASIAMANGAANPAQSNISKREYCSHRNSLANVIAEHGNSEVVICRFGLSAFKHITHHRHSLLLRICVLVI